MTGKRILIVDDEDSIRFGVRDFLEARGYTVAEADGCARAREVFAATTPDAAILDYRLHDGTAIDLLRHFRQIDPDVPLVVLTAYGSIELAVEAVKEGAEQFLTKPIELPALLVILKRLLANRRMCRQQRLHSAREERERVDPLAGDSPAIRALAAQVGRVLGTDNTILILGETGTGKSLLARYLHEHGPRAAEAFVDLNCAGLAPDFLETELFGHEKGAFTGAAAAKQGLLEIANHGTVFLDEIGDVDAKVQPKLLKVLEEKQFRRMGSVATRSVDVALIAATHHDLADKVKQGGFRSDLYFRISSIPLTMPPLRERREDIAMLAEGMLARIARDLKRDVALGGGAVAALRDYAWPGNIRKLRNVLERAALLCDGGRIERGDLRFETAAPPRSSEQGADLTLQEVEKRYIERVLREEDGRVAEAAQRLGIPRSTLYQKIKTYGISR